jgi:hypothetical protein
MTGFLVTRGASFAAISRTVWCFFLAHEVLLPTNASRPITRRIREDIPEVYEIRPGRSNPFATCRRHSIRLEDLAKIFRLEANIVHESTEAMVDIGPHVQDEEAIAVDLTNAIDPSQTEAKHLLAFFRKFGDP